MIAIDTKFSLDRFVDAQQFIYATVLKELAAGKKQTHWMWYIFPQLKGLGHSSTANYYAIKDLDEGRAYLKHPLLGPRLIECINSLSGHADKTAADIFSYPDDLKFCSSMTLFGYCAEDKRPFTEAINNFCNGQNDEKTLAIIHSILI